MSVKELGACSPQSSERTLSFWGASKIPSGNADDYQNKGVAEKAIRNKMKTKDGQIDPQQGWALKFYRKAEARELREERLTRLL
jgi:hypothetical protein